MKCKNFISKVLLTCLFCVSPSAGAEIKLPSTVPTAEFEKMAYFPVYPTFSWEPLANTEFYQIQVFKVTDEGEELYREFKNNEALNRETVWESFNEVGKYFWQVRAVDKNKNPVSDWSVKKYFEITTPVNFAVLGDSISHGGAGFIPASQISCQWQTFCKVPIKNIARSGDVTEQMIERFNQDVLPFKPKFLIIFAGVNDVRKGSTADEVIKNLKTLKKKCEQNKITPVFTTITPMNEKLMRKSKINLTEKDWRGERKKVNAWILKNKFSVDIAKKLYDDDGELRAEITPDGLHPDLRGKKFIGEAIEKFLLKKFSEARE